VHRRNYTIYRQNHLRTPPFRKNRQVEIRCFSRFTLLAGGAAVNLHSAKAEELIAFLVCEQQSVSKHKVAETLWPDADDKHAMDSLYKTLRHISKISADGKRLPVIDNRNSLQIDFTAVLIDTYEFLSLCGSSESDDRERAVGIYKSGLLIDNNYDWAIDYEADYDIRYYELLQDLGRHFSRLGDKKKVRYYKAKMELYFDETGAGNL
jgi:two-component SAPR family response regulator